MKNFIGKLVFVLLFSLPIPSKSLGQSSLFGLNTRPVSSPLNKIGVIVYELKPGVALNYGAFKDTYTFKSEGENMVVFLNNSDQTSGKIECKCTDGTSGKLIVSKDTIQCSLSNKSKGCRLVIYDESGVK